MPRSYSPWRCAKAVAPFSTRPAAPPYCSTSTAVIRDVEVDDHAAVAQGAPAHVVAAPADRDEQAVFARKADRRDDVGQAGAAGDQPRPPVDAGVPYPARGIVLAVAVKDECPAEGGAKWLERRGIEGCRAGADRWAGRHQSSSWRAALAGCAWT
jgi:hypothetical protein